jgi:hypothetical protein
MNKNWKLKVLQSVCYLVCLLMAWKELEALGPSEFRGGSVTRPLFSLLELGAVMFLLAIVVTFFRLRVAAVSGVAAALLCLPVSLYFLAPGPFHFVFRGEYSVPLRSNFVWSRWTVTPTALFVLAIFVSVLAFWMMRHGQMPTVKS